MSPLELITLLKMKKLPGKAKKKKEAKK